jgi:ATP-dependent DNA helicase DinG
MTSRHDTELGEARIARAAQAAMRATIRLAGGREVCFVGTLDDEGQVVQARVVARGDISSVLALPGVAQRGEMLLHNHPSGNLEPSGPDLSIAAKLHDDGVGFGIIDNDASRVYVVTEVPQAAEVRTLDAKGVAADLGPGGAVAQLMQRRFGAYEDRPAQRRMANGIARAYNGNEIVLLEAGTGVGKSMGYLVPALRWAAANNERTIVSTNTITLQEQLVGKDLPFLADALTDQPVRFALLKGWRNYLCLQRLDQARNADRSLLEADQLAELESVALWAESTKDGSIADLPAPPRSELWDEVAAEPDLCQRVACKHYEPCFLFKARREAAQADVVVVNHHLLLADLAVRRTSQNWNEAAVLPSYDRLIVDEGHHLEEAAAQHLGTSVTRRGVQRLFGRLERRNGSKGVLPALVAQLLLSKDLLSTASLDLVQERILPATRAARGHAEQLFDTLDRLLDQEGGIVRRLREDMSTHSVWGSGIGTPLDQLAKEVNLVTEGLRLVRERLETDISRGEKLAPLLNEVRAVARRLESALDGLQRTLRGNGAGDATVRWVEASGKLRAREGEAPARNIVVTSVPLDLAPTLRTDLFDRLKTAVITSATLATDGNFDFVRGRLGLVDDGDERIRAASLPSPFDYEEQAVLAIPTDVPVPGADDAAAHAATVLVIAEHVVRSADGGCFVLFTSHRDLREAAARWRTDASRARWPLLVHGEEGRDVLLQRFRDAGNAVLFGTSSFWEGVDVAGEALRALVITKLPFRVPSEPLTAAHCEAIEARGGNPFLEYMVPHATLRLKQGVGRLIRRATDRGVIVIADPRLVTKRYGQALLDALPPARRCIAPWARVADEVARFYSAR